MHQKADLISPVNVTELRANEDPIIEKMIASFQADLDKPFKLYLDHGNTQTFTVSFDDGTHTFTSVTISMDIYPGWFWRREASAGQGGDGSDGIEWTVKFNKGTTDQEDVARSVEMSITNNNDYKDKYAKKKEIVLSVLFEFDGPPGQAISIDPQIVLPPNGLNAHGRA